MEDFFIQILASYIGYGLFTYTHGLIFTIFKADQYEKSLDKIVYENVKKALEGK